LKNRQLPVSDASAFSVFLPRSAVANYRFLTPRFRTQKLLKTKGKTQFFGGVKKR